MHSATALPAARRAAKLVTGERDVYHTTMVGRLLEMKAGGGRFEFMAAEDTAEDVAEDIARRGQFAL